MPYFLKNVLKIQIKLKSIRIKFGDTPKYQVGREYDCR